MSFPIETLFPGIHAANPEVAEADGWAHLLHGHRPAGFDLSDPTARTKLLDGPAAEFVAFQLVPVPAPFDARLAEVGDLGTDPRTVKITDDLATYLALPAHLCVIVSPENEVWIYPR